MAAAICTMLAFSSCSNFFDEDSTYVINADDDHLNNATDTIYSVTGILNKLQAIADRTVLLGEARGDLVDVTSATSSDLRALANFTVGDDNAYNVPRDYYAIINNCNYFIAKVDTAMKNNRNENIFKAEYAAVKAIRAWTYLQMVTTYGRGPFVTTPILTKEEAEKNYPSKDIKGICEYFLHEDGLAELVDQEYPNYGDIKSLPSPLFFIPMRVILGDLSLWNGDYMEAAKYYYAYITNRNGTNTSYPIGTNRAMWPDSQFMGWVSSLGDLYANETNTSNGELITMIPMDSIPSEGYYSQIRNIFNTSEENDYKVSLVPSKSLKTLSAAQMYCHYDEDNGKYFIAPKRQDLEEYNGDLRLGLLCRTNDNAVNSEGKRYSSQKIQKYSTRNIHIYRRTLVYLRLAEALNCAGFPHYAYQILASGVNKSIITDSIGKYYSKADSAMLVDNFTFPDARYIVWRPDNNVSNYNTIGIHSRGSGFTPENQYYKMPTNSAITDPEELRRWQQEQVEELIVNEEALEFAFEGHRFYDLMRVALRRNDPSYLAKKIAMRSGTENTALRTLLEDTSNWYLKWNGQIGIDINAQ